MKFFQNKMMKLRNVFGGMTLMVLASNAFAHVQLESAKRAINASITGQPQQIKLNFAEEVMLMNIKLLDAQGKGIYLDYQVKHDLKKSFEIAVPKLKEGKYRVVWSTMGKDGHNMGSEYSFTLKATK